MVTVSVVSKATGVPVMALYRLAWSKKIRVHTLPPQPWHQRRQLRFLLSEVAEDLAKIPKPRPE